MSIVTAEEWARFNLSILECKSDFADIYWVGDMVLIYPYWNVNNRVNNPSADPEKVLIYPYWNVNRGATIKSGGCGPVLIYPYWNVNRGAKIATLT